MNQIKKAWTKYGNFNIGVFIQVLKTVLKSALNVFDHSNKLKLLIKSKIILYTTIKIDYM